MFFKSKVIPLILAFTFVLPSSLEYGSTTAWAQEPNQGMGQAMPSGNQTGSGMHNPCFPNASNGTHKMHHSGNMTGSSMMHQYSKNGTMGNGTRHFGQSGNQTGFKMHPCTSQNPTPGNNSGENSIMAQASATNSSSQSIVIPSWVKKNAGYWATGQLGDSDFVSGMQYLVQQGIMKIPLSASTSNSSSQQIPSWVKTNAGWWANGQISDSDFIKGIQYLVSSGIIKVT
ncbi:MAG: hypothetical protein WCC52_03950 [Nitrosotalea sp.]